MFYFVACILGILFLRERSNGKINLVKTVITMVFATVVFGILIEVIQHEYTVQRIGDVYDALANSTGSICGALAVKFFFSRKRQLKWKH
jgi:VanZ family protein